MNEIPINFEEFWDTAILIEFVQTPEERIQEFIHYPGHILDYLRVLLFPRDPIKWLKETYKIKKGRNNG